MRLVLTYMLMACGLSACGTYETAAPVDPVEIRDAKGAH